MSETGTLTVSLDFELYWGTRDHRSLSDYGPNILGGREGIPAMLDLRKAWVSSTISGGILVDPGVDTGGVLGQALIEPTAADNFATYPLLQLAAGLPLLKKAVHDALTGTLAPLAGPSGVSRQWYHPTAWGYLRRWYAEGVR